MPNVIIFNNTHLERLPSPFCSLIIFYCGTLNLNSIESISLSKRKTNYYFLRSRRPIRLITDFIRLWKPKSYSLASHSRRRGYRGAISTWHPQELFVLARARLRSYNTPGVPGEEPGRLVPTYQYEFSIVYPDTRTNTSLSAGASLYLRRISGRMDELVLTSGAKDYEGSPRLEFNRRRDTEVRTYTFHLEQILRRTR